MKKNITDKIESLINSKSLDKTDINSFVDASNKYDDLVMQGLTSKRDYNILTVGEIYTPVSNCQYDKKTQ